jgi:hypothetical protein
MFLVQAYRDEASHRFFNLLKEGIISIIENLGVQLNILTFEINQIMKFYVEKMVIFQKDYFFLFLGKEIDFEAVQSSLLATYYSKIQNVVQRNI